MTRVWLNSDRWNQAYLYDTATGRHQAFQTKSDVGTTAGNGDWMSGRFVATYVGPDNYDIYLQVGELQYPVDGTTRAEARVGWGGLFTTLLVERTGQPTLRLRQRTSARWLLRRVDPSWDALDELAEDRAAGLATLINSADARESYRRVHAPGAGPWDLLSER